MNAPATAGDPFFIERDVDRRPLRGLHRRLLQERLVPALVATVVFGACTPGTAVSPADTDAVKPVAAAKDAAERVRAVPATPSVRPGINEKFLDPDLDVDQWQARFEGESREVFVHRAALAAAVGLRPGDDVADVGAGTGLFLELFAAAVGPEGRVYALDISPVFVEHLRTRAAEAGLAQVEPRLCGEDSVDLPPASIDRAFVCDTYHHFEHPARTMASLHRALRPGGEVVIVDFERIPGRTRAWILDHVRAGRREVTAEIESFGFSLVEEVAVPGVEENYVLRFRRR